MTKRFTLKLNRIYDNNTNGTVLDTILNDNDVVELLNAVITANIQKTFTPKLNATFMDTQIGKTTANNSNQRNKKNDRKI